MYINLIVIITVIGNLSCIAANAVITLGILTIKGGFITPDKVDVLLALFYKKGCRSE